MTGLCHLAQALIKRHCKETATVYFAHKNQKYQKYGAMLKLIKWCHSLKMHLQSDYLRTVLTSRRSAVLNWVTSHRLHTLFSTESVDFNVNVNCFWLVDTVKGCRELPEGPSLIPVTTGWITGSALGWKNHVTGLELAVYFSPLMLDFKACSPMLDKMHFSSQSGSMSVWLASLFI